MISDREIQTDLMLVRDADDAIKRKNAYQSLYNNVQIYFQQFRQNHLSYISLYNNSFSTHTYAAKAESVPDAVMKKLIAEGKAADGSPVWVTRYCDRYGLFLVREIRQIQKMSLDELGVLVICVNPAEMVRAATEYGNQYKGFSYLLYDREEPVYVTSGFSKVKAEIIRQNLYRSYDVISADNTTYFAVKGMIPNYRWEYVSLVDYDSIYQSVQISLSLYVLAIVLCALLSILLSNLLVRSLVWHFDNLIRKMRTFGREGAKLEESSYDYRNRRDEFGILHRQFDKMARQIKNLIQINYTSEILRKDAQIKAMETEINPHFLYNTLESINWRAKAIGEKDISSMVESLGKLLRSTLSEKSDSTLQRELELVECYMTIQKIRFEDRLCFQIDSDPGLNGAALPKLTIQPLVENAVRYGLEENTDVCRIAVSARRDGDDLLVFVRNSGSRFEEGLLEKLDKGLVKPHGMGIGLLNIQKRLQLVFGGSRGLSLYNEDQMAVAQIRIPYRPG